MTGSTAANGSGGGKASTIPGADGWKVISGESEGQTQISHTTSSKTSFHTWAHPFDVSYSCSKVSGWPKVAIEVWEQDMFGRNQIAGYGTCFIPCVPGMHHIECVTWVPEGSMWDRVSTFFLGGFPMLTRPDVVHRSGDRLELSTISSGSVILDIQVLHNGFKGKGMQFAGGKASFNTGQDGQSMNDDGRHDEPRTVDADRWIKS